MYWEPTSDYFTVKEKIGTRLLPFPSTEYHKQILIIV